MNGNEKRSAEGTKVTEDAGSVKAWGGWNRDRKAKSSIGVQKATRSMKGIFPPFRRYFHSAYVLVRVAQVP